MASASTYRPDGFQTVNQGINSGVPPNLLPRNQLSFAVNTTFRSGFPENRPPWSRRPLKFLDQTGAVDPALQSAFESGLFQGAVAFERKGMLVLSVAGHLYAIDIDTYLVQDVSIRDSLGNLSDLDRPDLRRCWFTEAEDWIIRQDGQARPLLFDGARTIRADSFNGSRPQVPAGTVMEYANGRLTVASLDRRSFVIGDLVFSSSGTSSHGRRDAILYFTENEVIAEGGAFPIPLNSGAISAMRAPAQLDTSQGQGPLQVFTERGGFSVNAPADRTQWQSATFPIQSVSLINAGPLSDWSTVNVNGDIWFRSGDGLRSFQVSRRDTGQWTNTAMSKEVERILNEDDQNHLGWSSAALFDNRLLCTCAPYRNYDHGIVHRGLAVLDFNPAGTLSVGRIPPVWEGLWTGLNVLQIVSGTFRGRQRAFLFTLSSAQTIQLWELESSGPFDYDGSQWQRIAWQLECPSYNWEDKGWRLKSLETADLWYDHLAEEVSFSLSFRPDQDPLWQSWHSWTSSAAAFTCATANAISGCATAPSTLATQYRQRVRIPRPADSCDPLVNKPRRLGYEFQPRLSITGAARIKKFRLWAQDRPEETEGACLATV